MKSRQQIEDLAEKAERKRRAFEEDGDQQQVSFYEGIYQALAWVVDEEDDLWLADMGLE